jgi:hypothetical protein
MAEAWGVSQKAYSRNRTETANVWNWGGVIGVFTAYNDTLIVRRIPTMHSTATLLQH